MVPSARGIFAGLNQFTVFIVIVLPDAHHGQVSEAIVSEAFVNSCRSGCHFSPATFSQARVKPRFCRAIIFLENPTLSDRGRLRPPIAARDRVHRPVAGIAGEIPLFIAVDGGAAWLSR